MKQCVMYISFLFIVIMMISSCINIIPSTATLVLENDSDKIVDIYIESTKNNIKESFPLQVEITPSSSKEIEISWKEFGDVEIKIFGTYEEGADKENIFYIQKKVTLKNQSTLTKTILNLADEI